MYRYFISFQGKDGVLGNQEVQRSSKITDIKDVQEVSRDIEVSCGLEYKSIAIMNFKLFDDED